MVQKKEWWKSKTIWGIIMALVAFVLNQTGITLPDAPPPNADLETFKLYAAQLKEAKGNVANIISIAMAAVGTLLGIYGRVTAEAKIDS